MVAVDIKDVTGSKTGTIDLDPKTFGLDPNVAVMHQVCLLYTSPSPRD